MVVYLIGGRVLGLRRPYAATTVVFFGFRQSVLSYFLVSQGRGVLGQVGATTYLFGFYQRGLATFFGFDGPCRIKRGLIRQRGHVVGFGQDGHGAMKGGVTLITYSYT